MLNFSSLSLRRGVRELLHSVDAIIHRGQKVGLTGANGVGKSSLFALIRGELQPDAGDFTLPPNTVIAHVAQETPAVSRTALEYVLDGDQELRAIEQQLVIALETDQGELIAHLHGQLDAIDGYAAPSRAAQLLHGLGFSTDQEQRSVASFSGGWRMRLNLAQALMCRSDLLLLDEPTNHLDLDAVIWLEDWLCQYPGTLILISHDRDFLDRVVTYIAHIEQNGLTIYSGNYSSFELLRAERLAGQQAAFERQQREIAKMQRFVDRFKAKASKAKQAQSRVKALERMTLISQAHCDSPFNFTFKQPDVRANPLLQLQQAVVGYGDEPILSDVSMVLNEGARVGLLGHNGAGKSTLIKLLAGQQPILDGERQLAKAAKIGYFAQHQLEQLDDSVSPMLHLQRLDPGAREQELRTYLGHFAFNGDMAMSPVAPFSGGEKARLVLAMIVYQRPNLLLLDEPTNHLDLEMRYALMIALQDFVGAMVIVSHDRHLIRTVTDSLYLVDNGRVKPFDGDLDDYRQWVKGANEGSGLEETGVSVASKKRMRQQAAANRRRIQPLTHKVKKLEQELEHLHQQQQTLHQQLLEPSLYEDVNKAELTQLLQQQRDIDLRLEQVESQWLEASEELEGCR